VLLLLLLLTAAINKEAHTLPYYTFVIFKYFETCI
jgi:hypothetical protein